MLMNSRKKIVHVITGVGQGGAETVLLRLTSGLTDFDHCVISLTPIDSNGLGPLFNEHKIPLLSLEMNPRNPFSLFKIWKLKKILQQEKPAILQTWMYHANLIGGIAGRMAGISRIIWNIRNGALEPGGDTGKKLNLSTKIGWVAKLGALTSQFLPHHIISCSERAAEIHKKWGYAKTKFHIIHNGISISDFKPDKQARKQIRDTLQIDINTKVIGLIGRYHPQKDIPTFLKTAHILCKNREDIKFILVGTNLSSTNKELIAEIKKLGLEKSVLLLGKRQDISNILNAFDVLCSSSSFGEAFPNVVAEAMSCGVPCVVTDVGDSANIVGDLGIVVLPSSPEQMATACLKILETPPSPKKIQERINNHFSLDKMVGNYKKFYYVSETLKK